MTRNNASKEAFLPWFTVDGPATDGGEDLTATMEESMTTVTATESTSAGNMIGFISIAMTDVWRQIGCASPVSRGNYCQSS